MRARLTMSTRRCYSLASLCLAAYFGGCATVTPDSLVIRDVAVIDAAEGLRPGRTVRVRGDRIVAVEPFDPDRPVNAEIVLDGAGRYLLPGLWDMHVHLTFNPDLVDVMPGMLLGHGITYVRDNGGDTDAVIAAKSEATADPMRAPDVYISGPLLDGERVVYNGGAPGYPAIGIGLDDAAAARAAVAQLAGRGVDQIKVYEMLEPEVYAAAIDAAGEANLPVAGHIPLAVEGFVAARSGIDALEHLRNVELACSAQHDTLFDERLALLRAGADKPGRTLRSEIHAAQRMRAASSIDPERCDRLIAEFVERDVAHNPTLALAAMFNAGDWADTSWQQSYDALPEAVRSSWLALAERLAQGPGATPPTANPYHAWFTDWIARFSAAGGTVFAGTDTPVYFMTPGASLHRELQLLVEAGLTPLAALAAATTGPARYFGLDESQGRIAVGQRADLLLLKANPLDDIRNTRTLSMLIRRGEVIDKESLTELRGSGILPRRRPTGRTRP